MSHSGRGQPPSGDREDVARAVLAADTSLEAERVQVDLWRAMSSLEKARITTEISRAAQEFALLGIRRRHPGSPERELMLRLAVEKLGRELAELVYPEARALIGR